MPTFFYSLAITSDEEIMQILLQKGFFLNKNDEEWSRTECHLNILIMMQSDCCRLQQNNVHSGQIVFG